MSRFRVGALFVAVAGLAVACQEEALVLSEGASSTLSVRVYVDADGNGAFDAAADVAVNGATVGIVGPGTDLSGATDATGLATFDVPPGSYTLSLSGAAPAGAVLATATTPVVEAPFQGGTLSTEFRYSFLPGSLALVVFRDDDANGSFDPATDTPAGGLGATLVAGTDTAAAGNTAADGSLVFAGLRPGSYTLNITPFPTIQLPNATQMVTVTANTQTDVAVTFTGNLVVAVTDARNVADGDAVAIEGVVSWQAQFRTSLDAFMQDGTAGITLFDFNHAAVTIGDSIRVVGRKGTFRGEVQIDSVFTLDVLGSAGEPAPQVVSAAEINAGDRQSELVTIDGTVDSLQVFSFDNHMVWLTDGAAGVFKVFVDSRVGVGSADWMVGQLYTIVGVLGSDNRDALPFRIELRGSGDMVLGGSTISIASARTMTGQVVTVEGTLTWQAEFQASRLEGFMQDGTAGIALFDFGVNPTGLQRGDRLRIRGTVSAFRGELQLGSTQIFAVVGTDPLPTPRAVTAAQINAPSFQGELVTITGTVDSLTVDGFDNATVFMRDTAGDTFVVFSDSRTGVASTTWVVSMSYTVTGPLGFDNRNTLPARVEVRGATDIQ